LAYEIDLDPGAEAEVRHLPENGDICLVCLEGDCSLLVGENAMPFAAGSSLHVGVEEVGLTLRGAPDARCRVLAFLDPKEALF
jgi:uncharacterized cupin superfamily protein